jgi:hypothetical protein
LAVVVESCGGLTFRGVGLELVSHGDRPVSRLFEARESFGAFFRCLEFWIEERIYRARESASRVEAFSRSARASSRRTWAATSRRGPDAREGSRRTAHEPTE